MLRLASTAFRLVIMLRLLGDGHHRYGVSWSIPRQGRMVVDLLRNGDEDDVVSMKRRGRR